MNVGSRWQASRRGHIPDMRGAEIARNVFSSVAICPRIRTEKPLRFSVVCRIRLYRVKPGESPAPLLPPTNKQIYRVDRKHLIKTFQLYERHYSTIKSFGSFRAASSVFSPSFLSRDTALWYTRERTYLSKAALRGRESGAEQAVRRTEHVNISIYRRGRRLTCRT